ncbi:MAG: PDZ domain-containing protein [Spirochaetes bacterium]|nr:MAG: PDZ domain-containing protein [Spirochaetota bacterium]
MKHYRYLTMCMCLAAAVFPFAAAGGTPELNRAFIDTAKRVKPSVVNIVIYQTSTKDGERVYAKTGYGSGTIITEDGFMVTNCHVARKGDFYQVIMHDGTECEAEPFSDGAYYIADQKTDIALMKIGPLPHAKFQPVSFGDSSRLEEGEWVLAIGNPYGLSQSISSGIVSSKGRTDIGFADIEDFIQTDVPINPGNSGGPLVNLSGELVGINTAIRTVTGGYQGISFAIPSNTVKMISYELMRFGKIRRGWLGFLIREKKILAKGEKTLIEVISVIKDSPAQTAGIQRGDIIKEIDGKRISTLGELVSVVGNYPVGTKLRVAISRDGRLFEYQLLMREKSEPAASPLDSRSLFSLYGIEIDEDARPGSVVISYLSPMGAGYQYGLVRGDIIISLNGEPVRSRGEFLDVFRKNKSRIARLEISRDSRTYTIGFASEAE